MKKHLLVLFVACLIILVSYAQKSKLKVPRDVKSSLQVKYPEAKQVTWEKEKGNYEANWGGKGGEDNSVMFTPSGEFIEIVKAIPLSKLPAAVIPYIKSHYKGAKIIEAGHVTDAKGKVTYEVEVNKRDIIFNDNGTFLKAEH